MFDQIQGKGAFFSSYPTRVVYDVSTSSSTLRRPDSPELHEKGDSALQQLNKTLLRSSAVSGCDPLMMASCRETMASAYAVVAGLQQDRRTDGQCHFSTRDEILAPFPGGASVLPRASDEEDDESSEVGGGFALEDGDDPEALLGSSSDEDKSAGRVLSELVCGFGPPPPPVVNKSSSCCEPREPTSSRRKRGVCDEVEDGEEEVESRFNNNSKRQKSEETDDASHGFFTSPDVSIIGTISAESQPLSDDGQKSAEDYYCLDQSADELQMLCDDFGFEMPEERQCSSCSKEEGGEEEDSITSGSARESRRQKIKATVKLLREAIPGGDCLDTAIVLDEAIHYVKLLQLQVQTLGAKRLAQRATR